jgi:hypothetical protein
VVSGCPALVPANRLHCSLHVRADLAEHLGAVERPCIACGRLIRKGDYLLRKRQEKTRRVRPGDDRFGWMHLACAPKKYRPSRRAIRVSAKPLFEGL